MSRTEIPKGYRSAMSRYDTQTAIGLIKRIFEDNLCSELNLKRISAPLFVDAKSGLNDNLNGVERPVSFDILATNTRGEVVHSLAKWKRLALHSYGFRQGNGLCTDMNAIRRDEELDNIHSVYVDQWDWEKVLASHQRNTEFLKETVMLIVKAICDTLLSIKQKYPAIKANLNREVKFISSEELLRLYPNRTPKERENAFTEIYKTVFITQIGGLLSNDEKHDTRAPDYDDWELNGDLLFWNDTLNTAIEISSMGIRVSPESLKKQLQISGNEERLKLPFHKKLSAGELPAAIGGGIGQSRLCMLLLAKAHICEVQASIWDEHTISECQKHEIEIF